MDQRSRWLAFAPAKDVGAAFCAYRRRFENSARIDLALEPVGRLGVHDDVRIGVHGTGEISARRLYAAISNRQRARGFHRRALRAA